jgi:alpha-ribazole phosphatase
MKKIYFVRHGVTEGNENNKFQLHTIPLSEKGERQANLIAQRLVEEKIKVDVIIASTMARASQTANIIAKKGSLKVTENELYEELRRPSVVRGKSKADKDVKAIMAEVKANFANPDWRHSDEENYFLLKERAEKALKYILDREEENILIVTHGGILKMMLSVIVFNDKITPEIFKRMDYMFGTSNTGISLVEYNDLGWYVKTWNDYTHLGEADLENIFLPENKN